MIWHPSKEGWGQTENLPHLGGSQVIEDHVSASYLPQTDAMASAGHTVGCSQAAEAPAVGPGCSVTALDAWLCGTSTSFLPSSSCPLPKNLVLQNLKKRTMRKNKQFSLL